MNNVPLLPIDKWDLNLSCNQLLFSSDGTEVHSNAFTNDLIPAALVQLPSPVCCLEVIVKKIPRRNGSISYGIATHDFPSFGTEEFGIRRDSWGIKCIHGLNSHVDSSVNTNGMCIMNFRKIEKGDIMKLHVNLGKAAVSLLINDEQIYTFKISGRIPYHHLVVGCTMTPGYEVAIVKVELPVDEPPNSIHDTTIEAVTALTNGIKTPKRLFSVEEVQEMLKYVIEKSSPKKPSSQSSIELVEKEIKKIKSKHSSQPKARKNSIEIKQSYSVFSNTESSGVQDLTESKAQKTKNKKGNKTRIMSLLADTLEESNAPSSKSAKETATRRPKSASATFTNYDGNRSSNNTVLELVRKKRRQPSQEKLLLDNLKDMQLPGTLTNSQSPLVSDPAATIPPVNLGNHLVMRVTIERERYGNSHPVRVLERNISLEGSSSAVLQHTQTQQQQHQQQQQGSVQPTVAEGSSVGSPLGRSGSKKLGRSKSAKVFTSQVQSLISKIVSTTATELLGEVHTQGRSPPRPQSRNAENVLAGQYLRSNSQTFWTYNKDGRRERAELAEVESHQAILEEHKRQREKKVAEIERRRLLLKSGKPLPAVRSQKLEDFLYRPTQTIPEYPGRRIRNQTETWIEKMRSLSGNGNGQGTEGDAREQRKTADNELSKSAVQMWPNVYNKLSPCDLLLSIEHCCDCKDHTSLRHDEEKYMWKAENLLLELCTWLHSMDGYRPLVRVGVVRFPRKLPSSNSIKVVKHTDDNPNPYRYGAFEVQVAYKSPNGNLSIECLHTKLKTCTWPTASILHRKLEVFLRRNRVQSWLDRPAGLYPYFCGQQGGHRCRHGCREAKDSQYLPRISLPEAFVMVDVRGTLVCVDKETNEVVTRDPRINVIRELRRTGKLQYPECLLIQKYRAKFRKAALSVENILLEKQAKSAPVEPVVDEEDSDTATERHMPLSVNKPEVMFDASDQALLCKHAVDEEIGVKSADCRHIPAKIASTIRKFSARIIRSHVTGVYDIVCSYVEDGDAVEWIETEITEDMVHPLEFLREDDTPKRLQNSLQKEVPQQQPSLFSTTANDLAHHSRALESQAIDRQQHQTQEQWHQEGAEILHQQHFHSYALAAPAAGDDPPNFHDLDEPSTDPTAMDIEQAKALPDYPASLDYGSVYGDDFLNVQELPPLTPLTNAPHPHANSAPLQLQVPPAPSSESIVVSSSNVSATQGSRNLSSASTEKATTVLSPVKHFQTQMPVHCDSPAEPSPANAVPRQTFTVPASAVPRLSVESVHRQRRSMDSEDAFSEALENFTHQLSMTDYGNSAGNDDQDGDSSLYSESDFDGSQSPSKKSSKQNSSKNHYNNNTTGSYLPPESASISVTDEVSEDLSNAFGEIGRGAGALLEKSADIPEDSIGNKNWEEFLDDEYDAIIGD